jgi:hypothetical protein
VLEYVALGLLLIVIVLVFYTFIYLHELPYEVAKHRNHPQQEAIYLACWLSLFTLHAIWPIVFIWAISKREPLKVAITGDGSVGGDWPLRFGDLEQRLQRIEERATIAEGRPAKSDDRGKKTSSSTGKA